MSHPKTLAMTSYDHVAVSHPGPSINTPPILCDRSPQRSAARCCLASSSRAVTVRLETSSISQEGRAKSRTLPDTHLPALVPSVSPKQNRETARVVGEWSKPAETLSRALSFFRSFFLSSTRPIYMEHVNIFCSPDNRRPAQTCLAHFLTVTLL